MMIFILLACLVAVNGNGVVHEVHRPQPYKYGYTIKDKEGMQHRQEAGNGAGIVEGNYGFIDNKGLMRQVNYVADHAGFRAAIKTNEPGTAGQSPAAVHVMSNDPYAHGAAVPYVSRVNDPVVPALYESNAVYGFPTIYGHRSYGNGAYGSAPYVPVQGHGHLTPVPQHGNISPVYGHHDGLLDGYAHNSVPMYGQGYGAMYGQGYRPMYAQGYMGGLAHSNLLGAGYRGIGGIVNYGTNLIGGQIRGYDTRFTNL